MSVSLHLIRARARRLYRCVACGQQIPSQTSYFRHDPYPKARSLRAHPSTHWCIECITPVLDTGWRGYSGHIVIPAVRVLGRPLTEREHLQLAAVRPLRVELVDISTLLLGHLAADESAVHRLSPAQLEVLICDRLFAMGLEPRRTGPTNRRDGGVDIVFWPREQHGFPFLGAAQVKHKTDARRNVDVAVVREFSSVVSAHRFNAGLLITNTSFSPDARWFAQHGAGLVKLRGLPDIRRWLLNNFDDDEEWREIPTEIQLAPGLVVKLR